MAIVPRVNPQAPQIGSLASVRNTTDVRANTDLGQAVSGLGRVANAFYEQEKQRNDVTAVMQARRELSDWEAATFDPANPDGIGKFRGQKALGANEALIPSLDERVSEIGSRLTPSQRAQFDQVSTAFRDSVQGRLNGHMQREHEAFLSAEQKATTLNLTNDATRAALEGDFGLAAVRAQELLAMQRAALTADGMPEELIKASEREAVSGIHAQVFTGMLATDPHKAQAYLDRYGGQMSASDLITAQQRAQPFVEDADAEAIAADAASGIQVGDVQTGDYSAMRRRLESGGNPNAVNRASGAAGPDQFLASTWLGMVERHKPEWAKGMDRATILKQRFNPERSGAMAAQLDKDNAAGLQKRGLPVTNMNLYLAHHFGEAGGAQIIRAAGNTPMQSLVSAEAYKANPHLHGKTKAQLLASFEKRGMGGVESGQSSAVTVAPPASLSQALELVRRDPRASDPRVRQNAEAKVRSQWAQKRADEAETERVTLENIRLAVENADPRANLRAVLGPQFEVAARQGWLSSLQSRLDQRATGTLVQSDPILVDALHREAVLSPATFAKRDILANADRLDTRDLATLRNLQADFNDPKKRAGAEAKWATDNERIESGLRQLGYAAERGKPEKGEAERGQFRIFYAQAQQAFIQKQGREPTQEEADKLSREVVRRVALNPSLLKQAAAAESYAGQVTEADRREAAADFKAARGREPTEAELIQLIGTHYSKAGKSNG